MKNLQSYKIFESFKEDDYQQLVDTLQGELFDDNNIVFLNDDEEEEYFNNKSKYTYWCYGYNFDRGPYSATANRGTIRQITICNLSSEKLRFFMSELMHHILPIFIGRTGMKYQCDSFIEDGKKYIRIYLV
jgi:hypothetical protein